MSPKTQTEQLDSDDEISLEQLLEFYQNVISHCADALVDAADTLQICLGHMPQEPFGEAAVSLQEFVDGALGRVSNAALMATNVGKGEPEGPLDLTIQREPFESILDGTKTIEYREVKEYYLKRLAPYFDWEKGELGPFNMRLRNGYASGMPAIVVEVERVTCSGGLFELHLGSILEHKNLKPDQERKLAQPRPARG